MRAIPRANPLERRMSKFLREPPSVRMAASVIVTATALVVVGGGILIRLLDHAEYPTIWVGMWWAIQTVTTVGYGDVTPKHPSGRIVAVVVMLEGIAFLAIFTAAITSTFVARAQRDRFDLELEAAKAEESRTDARFDEIAQRLDQLETMIRGLAKPVPRSFMHHLARMIGNRS
jgi:voltage-gated potassium channel